MFEEGNKNPYLASSRSVQGDHVNGEVSEGVSWNRHGQTVDIGVTCCVFRLSFDTCPPSIGEWKGTDGCVCVSFGKHGGLHLWGGSLQADCFS